MPGRRQADFRSGDLAEDLGILLLKCIAAVADVPRQEDVGLDAIASLLRADQDGNYYAEDTFLVQLKSESKKFVDYRGHELTWFLGQTLPMFIGTVSQPRAEIALYSTIYVNHWARLLPSDDVRVRFGPPPLPVFFGTQMYWTRLEEDDFGSVWLGEPVVKWTLGEAGDPTRRKATYDILKHFLAMMRREFELMSYGHVSRFTWKTNDLPSIRSDSFIGGGGASERQEVVDKCGPALRALVTMATGMARDTNEDLKKALLGVLTALEAGGLRIEERDMMMTFLTKTPIPLCAVEVSGDEATDAKKET